MTLEDLTAYVLRECVRLVVRQSDKNHLEDPVLNVLAYKMSSYVNVLCLVAILGNVAEEDCSHVVASDNDRVFHVDSKKFKQVLDKNDIGTNFADRHRQKGDALLSASFQQDQASSNVDAETDDTISCVLVTCKVAIAVRNNLPHSLEIHHRS